jgi:hypothetical protein
MNMCGPQHRPPWILGRAGKSLNELEREEIELTGDQDRFSVTVGFEQRFSGFAPSRHARRDPRTASRCRARSRTGVSTPPPTGSPTFRGTATS